LGLLDANGNLKGPRGPDVISLGRSAHELNWQASRTEAVAVADNVISRWLWKVAFTVSMAASNQPQQAVYSTAAELLSMLRRETE
jgi:hypothetical protein